MIHLTEAERTEIINTVYGTLAGHFPETNIDLLAQISIDQCETACNKAINSRGRIDRLAQSFAETSEVSGIDISVTTLVLSLVRSILERRKINAADIESAGRLLKFISTVSDVTLKELSKRQMEARIEMDELKKQLDSSEINSIKFTTKPGRGWIDVGGSRMFLLDIAGGWHNFVERITMFAGADTSRRVLFEGGQSETFTTKALNLGILQKSAQGFIDAVDTLSEAGIGDFIIRELRFDEAYARITCPDTFEAWAYLHEGKFSDTCACHFSSGAFLSFMQHISGEKDLIATEMKCIAKGDDECEFLVGRRKELEQQGIRMPEWGMTIKERAEYLENLLVEKEKAEKEIRKKNTELAALNEIATAVSQSLEPKEISRLAIRELRKMVGYEAMIIYLLDATKQQLTVAAHEGFSKEFVREVSKLNLGEGLSGNVANIGIPSAYDDYSAYPFAIKAALEKEKLCSLLSVPLMAKKQVVGVLTVASKTPYHFTQDEIALLTMIGRQIGVATDNALLHKGLKESEQKYKTLVRDINDGYFVCQDDRIVFANETFCDMYGYDKDETLGRDFSEFLSPECGGDVQEMVRSPLRGRSPVENVEFLRRHRDGRFLPTELKISFSEFDGSPAIIGISRDISERKRLEQKVLENERLASIGQVAATLAHEIRNPISAIKMSIQILSKNLNVQGHDKKRFEIAMNEIKRLDHFLQNMLQFARPVTMRKAPNSIPDIISDCVDLLADKARERNIRILWKKPRATRQALVDLAKTQEVLINILLNSMDAVSEGGKIQITAKEVDTELGPMIEIEIKDSGIGIPQEHLSKVFDPFFSTKTEGSGLGLANVKRIVDAHNGAIKLKSRTSVGTSFKILLPVE